MKKITTTQVQQVSHLASIPISETEAEKLSAAFSDTLNTIENLQEVNTSTVAPTHQVTGLTNVYREDEVDKTRMFTQQQALQNAKQTYQGYIVVSQVLSKV